VAHLVSYANDSVHYVAMAGRLLAGKGYSFNGGAPDAYVSPGYPLFLALILRLFPAAGLTAVRWSQALLGAGTAALAASWAGLFAGVLVALYPSFIWSTGSILTEVAFLFLLVAYLVLHARLLERPRRGRALVTGAVLGLAVLTRPIAAALPFAIGLHRSGRRGLALVLAGAALVNLPWWIRNLIVLHRLILFASQAANPLIAGLAPGAATLRVPAGVSPYAFALQVVRSQSLGGFLQWMTVDKLRIALGRAYAGGTLNGGFLQGLTAYQVTLCWVGTAGLALAAFLSPRLRIAAVAAATLAVILCIFLPTPRYADPLMALLCIGAGALLAYPLSQWTSRTRPKRSP
jgi:hypothetical protein